MRRDASDEEDVRRSAHNLATTGNISARQSAARTKRNRRSEADQWRITSGVLPACARATCTDSTDNRTDGTHDAGIIWHAVPRTVPRPQRPWIQGS